MDQSVTFIGFGEAGSTFARDGVRGAHVRGFDIDPARLATMAACGVTACPTASVALQHATLVLSLVTADQALPAAQNYAQFLVPGALWCDFNSVAPATKLAAARAVTAAGARYVDVAVLAPVVGSGLKVPLLVAGPEATVAEAALGALGFSTVSQAGPVVGRASAIKMIRSVMVKGIEALTEEMMLAAQQAGVETEVLASLDVSEPALRWAQRAAYNRERMATHGLRRAAEMEESAKTLDALGIDPIMTRGTIRRQREAATQAGISRI